MYKKTVIIIVMVGLTNEGNTCYLNSALSCILYTPYIANNTRLLCNESKVMEELKHIFEELFKVNYNYKYVINSSKLVKEFKQLYPQFNNFNQQDAHEAFLYLILEFPKPLKQIYTCVINRKIYCKNCLNFTSNDEESNLFETDYSIQQYYCEKCKSTCNADVLVKYKYLSKVIMVKHNTNLKKEINVNDQKYILYAAILHTGNMFCGHYTSLVMSHNIWYYINDTHCKMTCNPDFSNAYILFYKATQTRL